MTGKLVSLSRARKSRARDAKKRQADANAKAFGRSKADRALDRAEAAKTDKTLDAHKRDPE